MYFWLKLLHIAAMALWFSGLFLLPRLLLRRAGEEVAGALARTLFFTVMTPAALATILLGTGLLAYGVRGAWLPAKLVLVAVAVLLHVYFGQRLHAREAASSRPLRVLNWVPLPLLLAIAALAAAKPQRLLPWAGW